MCNFLTEITFLFYFMKFWFYQNYGSGGCSSEVSQLLGNGITEHDKKKFRKP